ncbi:MAG: hypothetical protein CFE24_10500 [Flavobacterium sp. BFFFF2]|nr:MAG: hypothetical protein CFE24_10500 [Flavobacterium sp. BFFFF2]
MLKIWAAKQFAQYIHRKNQAWMQQPVAAQQKVFDHLISKAANTVFGKDHDFDQIHSHADFVAKVPLRDYEDLNGYINQVVRGGESILWPGIPKYFAKTSGTTSGAKYIPITAESMPFHIQAARDALLAYIYATGNAQFVQGKMIFLQGSPVLETKNNIQVGRLSGIVAHYVPKYLQRNRMPSWETNCIEDWEQKVMAIVHETRNENMSLISGIPAWVQMYFEKLAETTGQKVGDLFPNFSLLVYGGVNYEPYRAKMEQLIGRSVPGIELFPASEGFFAYQDQPDNRGLLLLVNAGIFYEFIPMTEYGRDFPTRLTIGQVACGVNYALVISTNAGLWGYVIGDTVSFTSLAPYRIIVTGRIKHFISAFGEHVIGNEVEVALREAVAAHPCQISEFTVAPQVSPDQGLPFHEWLIEFEQEPANMEAFALALDASLCRQNTYYNDLIVGQVLRTAIVTPLPKNTFTLYMKSQGKLGGQNKVPRLSNDRKMADLLRVISIEVTES